MKQCSFESVVATCWELTENKFLIGGQSDFPSSEKVFYKIIWLTGVSFTFRNTYFGSFLSVVDCFRFFPSLRF